MNQVSYFPGCSAHGTGREFDHSLKGVMKDVGVELVEVPDWNCCGASSAHVLNETLSLALPMRNLIQAETLKSKTLAIPCASCFSRHKTTKHELDQDTRLRQKIQTVVSSGGKTPGTYYGGVEVKSMLQYLFEDVGIERLLQAVKKPLTGLKVACYYGCLLTRPKAIAHFDSPENPMSLDQMMSAIGATPTAFDHKTECCGASFSISNTEIVYELTSRLLEAAMESGADIITVACPLCQANLDMRQAEISRRLGKPINLPVVYFTQLIGLAFGTDPETLEFARHLVPVGPALQKIGSSQVAPASSAGARPN